MNGRAMNGVSRMTERIDDQTLAEQHLKLARLRTEHADLDAAADALATIGGDRMRVQRLKKWKLRLKDQIAALEDELTPDIIA